MRLFNFIFEKKKIQPDNRRMFVSMNSVYLVGIFSHSLMLIMFFYLKIPFLGFYNIISVIVFISAFLLNRRGHHFISLYISGAEIFIHAIFSTYFLGWYSGFHYYCLVVTAAIFLANAPMYTKILMSIASSCIYLGLYLYSHYFGASYIIETTWMNIINLGNIIVTFFALAMLGMYYRLAAEEIEFELRKERNKLKKKNESIEKELELARKIQMSLIPSKSPNSQISFYYKPMTQVGGDFFDFIPIPKEEAIGIFVSDVSGHGVPAAFLTSMIKSFILQSQEEMNDPANFLLLLNDFLYNQSGGNFITAFYGVFKPGTREFTYANAGHNPPIMLSNQSAEKIGSKNTGVPLLVLTNEELKKTDKYFKNSHIILEKNSKLFLYTDGFTETINIQDRDLDDQSIIQDFEESEMNQALIELSGSNGNALIGEMIHRLIKFRGSNNFDDDVCIICLDIA